jgi:hypothetical protein
MPIWAARAMIEDDNAPLMRRMGVAIPRLRPTGRSRCASPVRCPARIGCSPGVRPTRPELTNDFSDLDGRFEHLLDAGACALKWLVP